MNNESQHKLREVKEKEYPEEKLHIITFMEGY